ncbi:uncharacterized protein EURHEDRAFT_413736 [Aspergillus ruber CBS 135680]|uniref:Carboxylesterase type B domain-containing protein n=1 Tax=Aspergillus ruber (strain CBS 135680) TaxID=1388766 RepID=A0A017SAS7_ASPRC|nr:uncharacterized protein EURHEDRAFT_413736 [Aspergillus ruber CBS 135680]EYE94123.1 hypothetical protein EURHEDRAFT_413736 [Aspergillus ruber CBS 135680]
MGQSAGSAAAQHILDSNLTRGLITGTVIESGVRDPGDPLCTSLAEAYTTLGWNILLVSTLDHRAFVPGQQLLPGPCSSGAILRCCT